MIFLRIVGLPWLATSRKLVELAGSYHVDHVQEMVCWSVQRAARIPARISFSLVVTGT